MACAFDDFEEAEFEAAVHVGENVFGLFLAVLNDGVAAILKRSQFVEPVLGDEPAAEIGAAFVGLEAAGHEQRELPAVADEREVALDEELEQIPVAGALALKGFCRRIPCCARNTASCSRQRAANSGFAFSSSANHLSKAGPSMPILLNCGLPR